MTSYNGGFKFFLPFFYWRGLTYSWSKTFGFCSFLCAIACVFLLSSPATAQRRLAILRNGELSIKDLKGGNWRHALASDVLRVQIADSRVAALRQDKTLLVSEGIPGGFWVLVDKNVDDFKVGSYLVTTLTQGRLRIRASASGTSTELTNDVKAFKVNRFLVAALKRDGALFTYVAAQENPWVNVKLTTYHLADDVDDFDIGEIGIAIIQNGSLSYGMDLGQTDRWRRNVLDNVSSVSARNHMILAHKTNGSLLVDTKCGLTNISGCIPNWVPLASSVVRYSAFGSQGAVILQTDGTLLATDNIRQPGWTLREGSVLTFNVNDSTLAVLKKDGLVLLKSNGLDKNWEQISTGVSDIALGDFEWPNYQRLWGSNWSGGSGDFVNIDVNTNQPFPPGYHVTPQGLIKSRLSLTCGFYGPYYAEVECDAAVSHPVCWPEPQFAGYCRARCACDPGGTLVGPEKLPPPPSPTQTCSIPFRQNLGCAGAGLLGATDLGCKAICSKGQVAVCEQPSCVGNTFKHSVCYCQ